jgi:hypothetical protein
MREAAVDLRGCGVPASAEVDVLEFLTGIGA